jgi:branched-chain amino acid transport system permease protein
MEAYLVAVAIFALLYMLMALGLNLQFGFTGLINFGHVGFLAIGAYCSALLTLAGWPIALGIAAAIVLGALVAWPLGLLTLRLRDDYLAIVTLGFSESLRIAIQEEKWLTKGVQGLTNIPRLFAELGIGKGAEIATLGLLLAFNLAAVLAIYRLVRSPYGRLIQAIRDDEDAVKALGKDPARFKIEVFVIGAGMAGAAGAVYAHYIAYISPEQFLPLMTFYAWMAIIMGGVGRVSGAVLGTLLLMTFIEGSRFLRDVAPFIPEVQMASLRLAAVGLALILFTLYRPQGIVGSVGAR